MDQTLQFKRLAVPVNQKVTHKTRKNMGKHNKFKKKMSIFPPILLDRTLSEIWKVLISKGIQP